MATKEKWIQYFDNQAVMEPDPVGKMGFYLNKQPVDIKLMHNAVRDVMDKLKPHGKILEIGCGIGILQSYVKGVVSIDTSFNMVKYAKQLHHGEYIVADAEYLPFQERIFDQLICYSVIHYFGTIQKAMQIIDSFKRYASVILIGDIPEDLGVKKESLVFDRKLFNHHEILEQNIPGKIIKSRFDVIIRAIQ